MVEKLGKQGFHYERKEYLNQLQKQLQIATKNYLRRLKAIQKAIEELDESNVHIRALELMNKNGIIHSSVIRFIAKLSVPTKKVNFDYMMILIVVNGMII